MKQDIIISIDWDHTFRNLAGLDLNILSLVLYAKSKNIPVGLTTHRDIENTTLYTLYYWQYEKPDDKTTALAAAISYWDEHLFKPFNLQFDFINARYQPLHESTNYYKQNLLPLEKRLAEEIINNNILENQATVRNKIKEYTAQKEDGLYGNDFKEKQMEWLIQQYTKNNEQVIIYHIDDCNETCQALTKNFAQVPVKTICYETSPLFSNQHCKPLLEEIGLLNDLELLLGQSIQFLDKPLQCLSLCLVALQLVGGDALSHIKQILTDIKPHISQEIIAIYQLAQTLIKTIESSNQFVCLMPNDLRTGTA